VFSTKSGKFDIDITSHFKVDQFVLDLTKF
jgi:hypothetical protein